MAMASEGPNNGKPRIRSEMSRQTLGAISSLRPRNLVRRVGSKNIAVKNITEKEQYEEGAVKRASKTSSRNEQWKRATNRAVKPAVKHAVK